jgi:glycosyltransferase involved in cell wall biosynthesis
MNPERVRKVIFIESATEMGGVQFSTLFLAEALDRAQWAPVVTTPRDGDLNRACHEAGIKAVSLDLPGMRSTSFRIGPKLRLPDPVSWFWNAYAVGTASRRLTAFLNQTRPDLVVTKGLASHFFGGISARKLRVPCVWHLQDHISERNLGLYRRLFAWAARWLPTQIIADGKAIVDQLPARLHSRTTLIFNGIDTDEFHPKLDSTAVRRELGIPSDQVVIGHLGRMTPWKGQHYLIEAFAAVAKANPHVTLLMVGTPVFDNDAYQKRLQNLVDDLGLNDRVKFAGYRHDTAAVMSAMDIFAFTSVEKDTSPLTLLSAMALGLPIVAFDIPGVRELVDRDDQLLRVPVGDAQALASALQTIISDPGLRRRLGISARELAEEKFSLSQYVLRIEKVFNRSLMNTAVNDLAEDAGVALSSLPSA